MHDFLTQFGGAERVLSAISELWPNAPIYTSFVDQDVRQNVKGPISKAEIRSSSFQAFPPVRWFTKYFTALMPLAFEQFDLSEFDVIISSSANFAKGVITHSHQLHICYCHTPPRFLYQYPTETNKRQHPFWGTLLRPLDNYLRTWDFVAAQRVDCYVANSREVARRIQKFYRRKAKVIYPPLEFKRITGGDVKVECGGDGERWRVDKKSGEGIGIGQMQPSAFNSQPSYFLAVSRLSAYKNIDLAIRACNKLGLPLKIVGIGPEEARLRGMAGPTIELLGFLSDRELAVLYSDCRVLIFPASDEDFGIVPIEAMSFGKPVIALRSGGVRESVLEGQTGVFFDEPTVESLMGALKVFDASKFDSRECLKQAAKFNKKRFQENFLRLVESKWAEYRKRYKSDH